MGKFKIVYIGWFFTFIGNCIRDLRYGSDCFNEIGLWKENWEDFKTRIYFDTDPEIIEIERKFKEYHDKNN
jgi:hypothetical protein